ncbi:hypothetical protein QR680_001279 [Steinernema hermaphroditum]|uniref:Uncharacterized protein n=1 Tax=Steinernema hermaphroditum TaxID=289476 RepID=A0AA39LFK1_9BILA|nr:hypothetical protein QR680_001279 [Steinernema hermaphroditum]
MSIEAIPSTAIQLPQEREKEGSIQNGSEGGQQSRISSKMNSRRASDESNQRSKKQLRPNTSEGAYPGFSKMRVRRTLNYSQIWDRFTRQSTFHGVSHAAQAPTRRWKAMWYIALCICATALIIQLVMLVYKYTLYAKTVDLDLKFENAPFPSVTLCNLNPYKASAINEDPTTRETMEAFAAIMNREGSSSDGVAAAIALGGSRRKRQLSNESKTRRYHQVYAQCFCGINRISGERKKGSCYAAYKGKVSLNFADAMQHFAPTKCLCQLDWVSKTLWPCFPYNSWKERMCAECSAQLGHCPMRFFEGDQNDKKIHSQMDVCLCHTEYNHCIASNQNGYIPEIDPDMEIDTLNMTSAFPTRGEQRTTTTTTTQTPELKQALGFEELKDDIAISTQAQQNLIFAVGAMKDKDRIALSQTKSEFILKCSFNQRDCDIERDFKLHYDQSYGNCFTFNWNRTKAVTAHRAGANYGKCLVREHTVTNTPKGLRVLLYANVSEYLPTSESVGFRITVHDKWIVPFPDAFGYSAPTGFLSSYGVRMKQFHRMTPPHGHCLDGGEDSPDFIYKGFNYSGCHRSCTQKEVIRVCGCADPMYPIPQRAKPCAVSDPIARDCIKNTTQHLGRLIAEGNVPNCVCHQPCRETGYEVTYSASRWPSGTAKVLECPVTDDLCLERYRKNAAMIQVFYEELNYETMTESPAYTMTSLFADFGGLTGLWVGASVVSLLEFVALGVYIAQAFVKKRKASSASSHQINPHIVLPPRYRRSQTSLSTNRSREELEQRLSPLMDETSEDEDTPSRKNTFPYLPPGADLPCFCTYDENGRIKAMKALCPEHGYMVRRGTGYSYGSSFEQTGDEEEELRDDEALSEQQIPPEEHPLIPNRESSNERERDRQSRERSSRDRNDARSHRSTDSNV